MYCIQVLRFRIYFSRGNGWAHEPNLGTTVRCQAQRKSPEFMISVWALDLTDLTFPFFLGLPGLICKPLQNVTINPGHVWSLVTQPYGQLVICRWSMHDFHSHFQPFSHRYVRLPVGNSQHMPWNIPFFVSSMVPWWRTILNPWWSHFRLINPTILGKTIRKNHPSGNGLFQLFIVKLWMVYSWFANLIVVIELGVS